MHNRASERRAEVRRGANAIVKLTVDEPLPLEFRGRLLDRSEHGFRAVHQQTDLSAGQEVRFRYASAQGRARVVWNRVLPKHVESGFLVLTTWNRESSSGRVATLVDRHDADKLSFAASGVGGYEGQFVRLIPGNRPWKA